MEENEVLVSNDTNEKEVEETKENKPKIFSRIVKSENPYGRTGYSTRRAKRAGYRERPRSERIKVIKPIVGVKPMKVVVRPGMTLVVEDELLLLGALKELKSQKPNIRLEYATESEEITTILKICPFIDRWHLLKSDEEWDKITSDSFGIIVEEPPLGDAIEAEKAIYDREFQAKTEEMEQLQASYEEAGMKDLKAPVPFYNFQSHWHKSSGLLNTLATELGITLVIPKTPINPYGVLPKSETTKIKNNLERSGIGRKPFLVYDLSSESTPLPLLNVLSKHFPNVELISLIEIQSIVGKGLIPLLVVSDNDNCMGIVSPIGKLSCASWSTTRTTSNKRWLRKRNRRPIIQMYTGVQPTWDGAQGENVYVIHRDNCTPEALPSHLNTASLYVLNNPTFLNV